jgi:hypothetical protein
MAPARSSVIPAAASPVLVEQMNQDSTMFLGSLSLVDIRRVGTAAHTKTPTGTFPATAGTLPGIARLKRWSECFSC